MVIGALALAGCSSGAVPTTTTSTTVRATSAGAGRSSAEAHLGNNQTFVASDRYIGRGQWTTLDRVRPATPRSRLREPFQAGDFVYIAAGKTDRPMSSSSVPRRLHVLPNRAWPLVSEGPNPNISNGNILQTEGFRRGKRPCLKRADSPTQCHHFVTYR